MSRFLRGLGDNENKIHLVGWDKVCSLVDQGRLKIHLLEPLNKVLLSKWQQSFEEEREAIWRKMIEKQNRVDSSAWMSFPDWFVLIWFMEDHCFSKFNDLISYKVGKGNKANFWEDNW